MCCILLCMNFVNLLCTTEGRRTGVGKCSGRVGRKGFLRYALISIPISINSCRPSKDRPSCTVAIRYHARSGLEMGDEKRGHADYEKPPTSKFTVLERRMPQNPLPFEKTCVRDLPTYLILSRLIKRRAQVIRSHGMNADLGLFGVVRGLQILVHRLHDRCRIVTNDFTSAEPLSWLGAPTIICG